MKKYLKIILPILALIILFIPGYTFIIVNKNFSSVTDSISEIFTAFKIIGLYAFTLIWFQLILGPFMTPLSRLYGGRILKFHRVTGTLAFCLAILHMLFFHISSYLASKQEFNLNGDYNFLTAVDKYVGPNLVLYGFFGPLSLTLLVATVTTALLRRKKHFYKYWRKIHFLNYLIFILVFLHSFNVGNDTQTQPLKSLYLFFMITFLVSFYYRVIWRRFLT